MSSVEHTPWIKIVSINTPTKIVKNFVFHVKKKLIIRFVDSLTPINFSNPDLFELIFFLIIALFNDKYGDHFHP